MALKTATTSDKKGKKVKSGERRRESTASGLCGKWTVACYFSPVAAGHSTVAMRHSPSLPFPQLAAVQLQPVDLVRLYFFFVLGAVFKSFEGCCLDPLKAPSAPPTPHFLGWIGDRVESCFFVVVFVFFVSFVLPAL